MNAIAVRTTSGRVPARRVAWVSWRQHRAALAGTVCLLGTLGLYLLIMGLSMSSGLNAQTVPFLLLAVPILLGVFVGAPVLARELESGTFRFAWTQACGRVRWAVVRLGLLAAALTVGNWLRSAHFTQWWSYVPGSDLWRFQLIEGGWLLALSWP